MWLKNLIRAMGFRVAALRSLAASQPVWAGIACYITGCLAYAIVRVFVYASIPELMNGRSGLLSLGMVIGIAQVLVFLLFLFVPAIVALSNAFSDEGIGLSFSAAECRSHIAALFPIWGVICIVTAPLQWLFPFFISDPWSIIGGSVISILRAMLLGIYTFWAVMRLNYLSPVKTCGVFALSALTIPIFGIIYAFIWSLPFLFLIPLFYLASGWIKNIGVGRSTTAGFQKNMRTLTVNPRNADAHYQLGRISLDRGDPAAARGYFEEAVNITQDVAEYFYYFGVACARKNDWDTALDCYEKAYRLDPEYGQGDIFREVGKAYINTGSMEKGKEFLEFFLKRREADPEGRYWLAVALQKTGELERARFQLTFIVEQAKANPRFYRKRNREWIYRARNLVREIKITTKQGVG